MIYLYGHPCTGKTTLLKQLVELGFPGFDLDMLILTQAQKTSPMLKTPAELYQQDQKRFFAIEKKLLSTTKKNKQKTV